MVDVGRPAFCPAEVEKEGEAEAKGMEKKAEAAVKRFYLAPEELKPLMEDWRGPAGCIATDRITVDGSQVGYCYREEPMAEGDSGWRFAAGDESEEYMNDSQRSGVCHLNTIRNYDPDILPLLEAPVGSAFIREENGVFRKPRLN